MSLPPLCYRSDKVVGSVLVNAIFGPGSPQNNSMIQKVVGSVLVNAIFGPGSPQNNSMIQQMY